MTRDDVFEELDRLGRGDRAAALDLYRRAVRDRVAWAGLATRLARMQHDSLAMLEDLAKIDREER